MENITNMSLDEIEHEIQNLKAQLAARKRELAELLEEEKKAPTPDLLMTIRQRQNEVLQLYDFILELNDEQDRRKEEVGYQFDVYRDNPLLDLVSASSAKSHKSYPINAAKYGPYFQHCFCCQTTLNVTGTHLLKDTGNADDYIRLGTTMNYRENYDPASPRNFIPLCGTLGAHGTCHHAFNTGKLTLIYDPFSLSFHFTGPFLTESGRENPMDVTSRIHLDCWPYKRALVWRARHDATIRADPVLLSVSHLMAGAEPSIDEGSAPQGSISGGSSGGHSPPPKIEKTESATEIFGISENIDSWTRAARGFGPYYLQWKEKLVPEQSKLPQTKRGKRPVLALAVYLSYMDPSDSQAVVEKTTTRTTRNSSTPRNFWLSPDNGTRYYEDEGWYILESNDCFIAANLSSGKVRRIPKRR